jgi:uncharacterized protein YbbK (DUF523 family)
MSPASCGRDRVEVGTLLGDMAYSDGDVREAVEEHRAELVAKVQLDSRDF